MDGKSNKLEGAGAYIWLSYKTQFSSGGRTHVLEMSIPVPIGASAEMREQLLREAEEGMGQLFSHAEKRIPQVLQQGQAAVPRPTNKPASVPAAQTGPQSPQSPLPPQPSGRVETVVPPSRQHVGASMPLTPGPANEGSSTLSLPEFIQYIKENLKLDPKQAMNLLKIKSLSGINLRDALERLKSLTGQEQAKDATPEQSGQAKSAYEEKVTQVRAHIIAEPKQVVRVEGEVLPDLEDEDEGEYEVRPVHAFDEEIDPDEVYASHAFTDEDMARASDIVSRLRESRGATAASADRIRVLHNIVDGQAASDDLEEMIKGVWGVQSLKKLKVDQLEALISWGKEDDFVNELEAVLALLEEERYARGNR